MHCVSTSNQCIVYQRLINALYINAKSMHCVLTPKQCIAYKINPIVMSITVTPVTIKKILTTTFTQIDNFKIFNLATIDFKSQHRPFLMESLFTNSSRIHMK